MSIKQSSAVFELPSAQLDDWGSVAIPLGEPIAKLSGKILSENADGSEAGVWECTPGKWVRQVMDAEFCTFISGHAIFTPENDSPLEIKAGDIVYFPRNSKGTWEVLETLRKTYITMK
jgi:uncharacterized cupin superfamily protein